MNAPAILQRHPALRWLVPVGIACLAGLAATGFFRAKPGSETLPDTTASALIAAVQDNRVPSFSGTVVSHLSLGLPELPDLSPNESETSFDALLSGSHTMQVWYGGAAKQRVALLGATDETDLFRNGRSVWQWSSADGVALHTVLPRRFGGPADAVPTTITPDELARRALRAVDSTTRVTVDTDHVVADRSAYELVLTPHTDATKVGSVHISVDGRTKVPLGVQVYPRGTTSAAIDVAFTSIRFGAQADRNFVFSPPPDAKVRHLRQPAAADDSPAAARDGWTSVVDLHPGKAGLTRYTDGALLKQLARVSGRWGRGRLLDAPLVSLLITDDGRVYAGAVDPAQLFIAAGNNADNGDNGDKGDKAGNGDKGNK